MSLVQIGITKRTLRRLRRVSKLERKSVSAVAREGVAAMLAVYEHDHGVCAERCCRKRRTVRTKGIDFKRGVVWV